MSQNQIILTPDECGIAIQFGRNILAKDAQSSKDFGSSLIRSYSDNIVDIIEGKIAEIGFSKFYELKTNNKIILDFNIYPDSLTIDYGQDLDRLIINSKPFFLKSRIDIKATKIFSKWLLVESHKFWSDAYILVKVDVPGDSESNFEKFHDFITTHGVKIIISGFAYYFDLVDSATKKPFIGFNQNERLFKPDRLSNISNWSPDSIKEFRDKNIQDFPPMGPILKSSRNFGLPIFKLRNSDEDWDYFFQWIHNSLEEET